MALLDVIIPLIESLDSLLIHTIEPATPEGIVVGTPKSDMQAADSPTAERPIERRLGFVGRRLVLYELLYMNITYEAMKAKGNVTESIKVDIKMPYPLPTVDDMYDQSYFEITPTGAIEELDAVLTTFLNALLIERMHELPIVKEMVKDTCLSFAESLFNIAWQNAGNLRAYVAEDLTKDLIERGENFYIKTDALLQAESLGYVSVCICFHVVEIVFIFCYCAVGNYVPNPQITKALIALLDTLNKDWLILLEKGVLFPTQHENVCSIEH